MLFSKEMKGVGILRFTMADNRVVYCFKDLCHLLGLKPNNHIRGQLNNKHVYSLTVEDNAKPIRALFIDIGNLNTITHIAGDTPKVELFSKWFAEELFPLTIRDEIFNLENITDKNVAMELLSEYEDLKFQVKQYEYRERKNKIYLKSMEELLGHKNMISLNVYFEDIFERGYPKRKFYALLRSHGILTEDNKVSQEYIDSDKFVNLKTVVVKRDKTVTVDIIFISKSGISLIEQLLDKYEGEKTVDERNSN